MSVNRHLIFFLKLCTTLQHEYVQEFSTSAKCTASECLLFLQCTPIAVRTYGPMSTNSWSRARLANSEGLYMSYLMFAGCMPAVQSYRFRWPCLSHVSGEDQSDDLEHTGVSSRRLLEASKPWRPFSLEVVTNVIKSKRPRPVVLWCSLIFIHQVWLYDASVVRLCIPNVNSHWSWMHDQGLRSNSRCP